MKRVVYCVFLFLLIGCFTKKHTYEAYHKQGNYFAQHITSTNLEKHVNALASEKFEGRKTGEIGQKLAANYIRSIYMDYNVLGAFGPNRYFQHISEEHLGTITKDSENVIAYIKGNEKPNEIILITSHYDHDGIVDGKIHFGADDNASGTGAVLEIAHAFELARKKGYAPKRSLLFVHFTAEEVGLLGSQYFVDHPPFSTNQMVAALNIDMIGRIAEGHSENPEYIYVIGSDRISKELHQINEQINEEFIKLTLDYRYNKLDDPNRYYFRSDHYHLAQQNIPVIFYFNGTHEDYHQPTDTPEKINYNLLTKRTQHIFLTAWELANRDEKVRID